MRLQLIVATALVLAGAPRAARAEDRAEASTTLYVEGRRGGQGALSVIVPQVDVSADLGDHAELVVARP